MTPPKARKPPKAKFPPDIDTKGVRVRGVDFTPGEKIEALPLVWYPPGSEEYGELDKNEKKEADDGN